MASPAGPSAVDTHVRNVLSTIHRTPGDAQGVEPQADWIAQSWQRSVERYRLDPAGRRQRRVVEAAGIREAADRVDALLDLAGPDLDALYHQVSLANYCLLLADADGLTLDLRNRHELDDIFRQAEVRVGTCWSEELEGTCGIGSALFERRPVLVHRNDHFRADNTALSCSAAPIIGPNDELLAVLDASALYSPYSRDSQALVFNMVAERARLIENRYADHQFRDYWRLTLRARLHTPSLHADWMIALDDAGRIVGGDRRGRERLASIRRALAPAAEASTAPLSLDQVFGLNIDTLIAAAADQLGVALSLRAVDSDNPVYGLLKAPSRGRPLQASTLPPVRSAAPDSGSVAIRPMPAADPLPSPQTPADLELSDPRMGTVFEQAARMLERQVPIVLQGETGSGKEALARALHATGPRAAQPFVAINCAAIPDGLIESELFGYHAGAFTGARSRGTRGLIRQADRGTLFLDEIGDMPLPLQSRLLRVLAEREVLPLGASAPVPVDLSVICASHQDLPELVAQGRFREDLYFRIAAAVFRLPPLRARSDLRALIERLLAVEAASLEAKPPRLTAQAMQALMRHPWPGNVRQLRNVLRFAAALASNGQIDVDQLPEDIALATATPETVHTPPAGAVFGTDRPAPVTRTPRSIARGEIVEALERSGFSATRAARALGIPRSTFYRRLNELGIDPPRRPG